MPFESLILSHLICSALFFQNMNFSAMRRINQQIIGKLKFAIWEKKFERSRDLLVKSEILHAEI